jgi:hypothetical protein
MPFQLDLVDLLHLVFTDHPLFLLPLLLFSNPLLLSLSLDLNVQLVDSK